MFRLSNLRYKIEATHNSHRSLPAVSFRRRIPCGIRSAECSNCLPESARKRFIRFIINDLERVSIIDFNTFTEYESDGYGLYRSVFHALILAGFACSISLILIDRLTDRLMDRLYLFAVRATLSASTLNCHLWPTRV